MTLSVHRREDSRAPRVQGLRLAGVANATRLIRHFIPDGSLAAHSVAARSLVGHSRMVATAALP